MDRTDNEECDKLSWYEWWDNYFKQQAGGIRKLMKKKKKERSIHWTSKEWWIKTGLKIAQNTICYQAKAKL